MSFFNTIANEFMGGNHNQAQSRPQGVPPPPQVPPPWRAVWDAPAGRYLFINEENGERTFDFPRNYAPSRYGSGSYGEARGYPPQQGAYPPQQNAYPPQQGGYPPQGQGYRGEYGYGQQQPKQHHYGEMALAGAAGLAGGALLMHEGEKVHNDYEYDKYRTETDIDDAGRYVERKWDNGVQDVENAPYEAAQWTGEEVQRVEDIPERIETRVNYDVDRVEEFPERVENRFDYDVDRVEDIPDDVAGWAGRKVGDVERFDDGIQDSYDQGRDDQRYDDNYRNDDY